MDHRGFDVVMGSDIIYVEDILDPLFDTVANFMKDNLDLVFLLSYARRNVSINFSSAPGGMG